MTVLPKFTASPVQRCLKTDCAAYVDLHTAYANGDEELTRVLTQHEATYREVTLRPIDTQLTKLLFGHVTVPVCLIAHTCRNRMGTLVWSLLH